MIGAAIRPRMIPALRTFNPTGTSNNSMMRGFMRLSPMNPQTTEGIAARSSTRTFKASLVLPLANSEM